MPLIGVHSWTCTNTQYKLRHWHPFHNCYLSSSSVPLYSLFVLLSRRSHLKPLMGQTMGINTFRTIWMGLVYSSLYTLLFEWCIFLQRKYNFHCVPDACDCDMKIGSRPWTSAEDNLSRVDIQHNTTTSNVILLLYSSSTSALYELRVIRDGRLFVCFIYFNLFATSNRDDCHWQCLTCF